MPPKKQPSLRQFLKKEVARDKNKVKHPDSPSRTSNSNNGGRFHLTQSNLCAFGCSPASANMSFAVGSPTMGRPRFQSPTSANVRSAAGSLTTRRYGFGSPASAAMNSGVGSPSAGRCGFGSPGSPNVHSAVGSPTKRFSDVNSLFSDRNQDVDSIFGEPLDAPSIREQEMQAQLEKLLTEGTPQTPIPTFTESTNLRDLKEELKKIVIRETDGNMMDREWNLLHRQKGPLIEEVRYMEEAERKAFEKSRTNTNQGQELPEPVGRFERKRLERGMKRVERAKAGAERSNKRPRQEERDNNNDLDGEERLRLGKSLKPKPLQMTGHFWSTRHDYFPGLPGAKVVTTESGAEVLLEKTLRDFDPEERKLKRRELAELGEALAKADRRMKR